MILIASTIRKGGSGKTSLAVHLAHGLALEGRKSLLVDLDSQGHCALFFGIEQSASSTMLLRDDVDANSLIQEVRPNLGLIPSDFTLALAETYLGRLSREARSARLLSRLRSVHGYDYCIMDVGPALSFVFLGAAAAADYIVIPVLCEYLAVQSVAQTVESLTEIGCEHKIRWVVPVKYDARVKNSADAVLALQEFFGDEKVTFPVPTCSPMSNCMSDSKTLFEFAPRHNAVASLQALVDRCQAEAHPGNESRIAEVVS